MDLIKGLLADGFGGVMFQDIPFLIFQLTSALFLAFAINLTFNQLIDNKSKSMAYVLSFFIVLLTALTKYSLSVSVFGAVALLFLLPKNDAGLPQRIHLFLLVAYGVICGSGFVMIAFLCMPIILPVIYKTMKNH